MNNTHADRAEAQLRAGVYARLSETYDAAESVPTQIERGSHHATRRGWTVAATFKDDGFSGFKEITRDGFGELIAAIEAGAVDVVIVRDIDRLTRNLTDWNAFEKACVRHGVRLAAYTGGDLDLSTAEGAYYGGMETQRVRRESAVKSARVREAQDREARKGRRTGGASGGSDTPASTPTQTSRTTKSGTSCGYDDHMDRVSGWYKRHVAKITLMIGAILVVLLNINPLTIGRTLYTQSTVSTAVSAVAAKSTNCSAGQSPQDCLSQLRGQLSAAATAGLPIGWGTVRDCAEPKAQCNWLDKRGIFSRHGSSAWQSVLVLIGFAIMIIALLPRFAVLVRPAEQVRQSARHRPEACRARKLGERPAMGAIRAESRLTGPGPAVSASPGRQFRCRSPPPGKPRLKLVGRRGHGRPARHR